MEKLIRGLHHFQNHIFSSYQELFERLAEGQSPEAMFITCSDSRIDPALITQTAPGDLFVLRLGGNFVPPYGVSGGESATIEYAVSFLGVKDIIVCGHSHCGAMEILLHPERFSGYPAIQVWLTHVEAIRRVMQNYADRPEEVRQAIAVKENVLLQLENLKTHPTVSAAVAAGTLHLHAWVYEFEKGKVLAFDPEEGQFLPLRKPREEF
ncbi:MAG TPA: carbonate dehydratase [Cyanobacteria bacterium UBA8530]|nr:carbonate dehydratase [Cyanobacteria bacterium UBA8530]